MSPRPRLTRPRYRKKVRQISTLHASEKTNPGMPPQSQALESALADNCKGKDETGRAGRRHTITGMQHGREDRFLEFTSPRDSHPPSSEQSAGDGDRGLVAPPSITAKVFVLDKHGNPLMPCHPARARKLLLSKRARVHHLTPFVIRLVDKEVTTSEVDGIEVSLDPGSRYTGVSVFRSTEAGREGLVSIEIRHRGGQIHKAMQQRANYRRQRRSKNLRYRAPRWLNRSPKACVDCARNARHGLRYCHLCSEIRAFHDNGYRQHRLAPSLQHRIDTTMSLVSRLRRWTPVTAFHMELVRFDLHKMANSEVSGVEYQHGTLWGYEVREYLLEKFERRCAYCGVTGVPLNVEHVLAKSKGGTNRVSNLVIACVVCNEDKKSRDVTSWCISKFGKEKGKQIAARVSAQAKATLKDASVVNSTRWALWRALGATGLSVSVGSGGRTKWNRKQFGIPKSHTLDALCVGVVNAIVAVPSNVLIISCTRRGQHQRTKPDKFGFPRLSLPRTKTHQGLRTGDLVRAVVLKGKHKGVHVGRVSVRSSGIVHVGKGINTSYKNCSVLQRADGYGYERKEEAPLIPALDDRVSEAQ